jgi:zinc transporter ZupT
MNSQNQQKLAYSFSSCFNFIYIAAADLVPEIKHEANAELIVVQFLSFMIGIALLLIVGFVFED